MRWLENTRLFPVMVCVLAASLGLGCHGCGTQAKAPTEVSGQASDVDRSDSPTAVRPATFCTLRVTATDGSYVHEVLVTGMHGEVLARGASGFDLEVPAGEVQVAIQGHTLPLTLAPGEHRIVSVAEQLGLGRLRLDASDGSYIHEVVVTTLDGTVAATGQSGFFIDLLPGHYRATVQGQTFDVEVTRGADTVLTAAR